MRTITYVYDDRDPAKPPTRRPGTPARVIRTIASPEYVPEDRALLMALASYEAQLCKCGEPRSTAWHTEMDGYYEGQTVVCFACTANAGGDKQVKYSLLSNTRPVSKGALPPFVFGVTTTDD
jgi:hypothetical protein